LLTIAIKVTNKETKRIGVVIDKRGIPQARIAVSSECCDKELIQRNVARSIEYGVISKNICGSINR
jgi:hypothetical protein